MNETEFYFLKKGVIPRAVSRPIYKIFSRNVIIKKFIKRSKRMCVPYFAWQGVPHFGTIYKKRSVTKGTTSRRTNQCPSLRRAKTAQSRDRGVLPKGSSDVVRASAAHTQKHQPSDSPLDPALNRQPVQAVQERRYMVESSGLHGRGFRGGRGGCVPP